MTVLPSLLATTPPGGASAAAAPRSAAPREREREPEAARGFAKALGAAREPGARPAAGPGKGATAEREAANPANPADTEPARASADDGRDSHRGTASADAATAQSGAAPEPQSRHWALPTGVAGQTGGATSATAAGMGDDVDAADAPLGDAGRSMAAALALGSSFGPRGAGAQGGRADAAALRAAALATGGAGAAAASAGTDATSASPAAFGETLALARGSAEAASTAGSARIADTLAHAAAATGALAHPAHDTTATGTAGPAEATLPSPPGSPAFAGELAARLTTFVRDGVEQARLQLNPAEMGPVEVRIALDGDAARVLMAAELPQTRQWLEQALPTLAATLRDAGLTLAGGGVFEQASPGNPGGDQTGGQSGTSGTPGRSPADPGAAGEERPAAAAAPRRRGVVDLVA